MILQHKSAEVFYSVFGSGKPIILIHGFLENSQMWNSLVEDLSHKNQVITVDLLGHGQSDCLGYVHEMSDYAKAILAIINHLKLNDLTFIGHSLGGYVALALAEMIPNKTIGLCLMNSTTESDSKERLTIRNRAIKSAKTHYSSLVSMSISNLFYSENRERLSTEIEQLKNEALKTPVQGYIAAQEGMKRREDKTSFFTKATFKKLIISGKKDPVLDYDRLNQIASTSKSEFVTLNGGHMSQIEDLADLKSAVLQFIKA